MHLLTCHQPGTGLAALHFLGLWAGEQMEASSWFALDGFSVFTGWAAVGLRDPGPGTLCPWGVRRAGGKDTECHRPPEPPPLSGSTDLEDMSVMVLRTQGPAALFDDHKLILHTSSYDAKWARVFHACGEFCAFPSHPLLGRGSQFPHLGPEGSHPHCWRGGPQFPHLGLEGSLCSGLQPALGVRGSIVRCGNSKLGSLVSLCSCGPRPFDWMN